MKSNAVRTWAVVVDGVVVETILADQAFIDSLPEFIADGETSTSDLAGNYVDISSTDPVPGRGWLRAKNGSFSPPSPSEDELSQQAAASARADDDAFLADILERLRAGEGISQVERDRLNAVQASRA